jgi:hypothetical protein
MNAIAFATKRTFHGFLRATQKPLASMGLTAARFDMLAAVYATRSSASRSHGVLQSDLRRAIGVTAPVVANRQPHGASSGDFRHPHGSTQSPG